MPTITKITSQKRSKDRFNIFLDGKYTFPVSEKVLLLHSLKVGLEISDEFVKEVVLDEGYEKIYHKTLDFLSYRIRSTREVEVRIREYLYKSGIEKNLTADFEQKIIENLKNLGFLNDFDFVKTYVENSATLSKPPGKRKMSNFLRKKGVELSLIDRFLDKYPIEAELKGAEFSIKNKIKLVDPRSYKDKQKIYELLMRKGYSSEAINTVVDSKFEV